MTHDYEAALNWFNKANWNADILDITQTIRHALELAIALQPKPISEVNHSEYVLGVDFKGDFNICQKSSDMFIDYDLRMIKPTHFYDISALPKPEVTE